MTKIIHNIKTGEIQEVELTAEEQNAVQAEATKAEEERTTFFNNLEANKNLKASAKAKLIAGEALTEEEANVMIGG